MQQSSKPVKLYNQRYRKLQDIGQGAYGQIKLCEDQRTIEEEAMKDPKQKFCALKKMAIKPETGIELTSIREIKILQSCDHPNIIKLRDVFAEKHNIYLAMEVMSCDVAKIVTKYNKPLSEKVIKFIFKQIIEGVHHLHKNWILHRDIKPDNILINYNGDTKLTDFGLARNFGTPERAMTKGVITRWYRPPEIFYGANYYSEAVDVWSCGCVLAELLMMEPLFPGTSEIDMLGKIFKIRGTPTQLNWPYHETLPLHFAFEECQPVLLEKILKTGNQDAINLVEQMLALNPSYRLPLEKVLEHPYLRDAPDNIDDDEILQFIRQQDSVNKYI